MKVQKRNNNNSSTNGYRTRSGRISMRAIRDIAKRITERFEVEKIILFGSYAYGKPTKQSDVDICVVMETETRPLQQSLEIIRELSPLHFGIDLMVRREEDFHRRIPLGDSFLKEIWESGRVLYEK